MFVGWKMQRDNVGPRKKVVERCVREIKRLCKKMILFQIIRDDVQPEAFRHSNHVQTDTSCADHPKRFSFQVHPPQSLQRKIIPKRAYVRFVDVAQKRQNKGEGVLSNGILTIIRNIADCNAPLSCLMNVDMVKTRASRSNEFEALQTPDQVLFHEGVDENRNHLRFNKFTERDILNRVRIKLR